MPKLLVTGASGFLGWNLCQIAAPGWEIYGVYRSHTPAIPGTFLKVDLTNCRDLQTLFHRVQPDAVVHLAAESNLNRAQENPEVSHQINVQVPCQIADLCAEADIPCVFASSGQVFDGLNPPYREDDPVSPVSLYGEQKASAEVEVLQRYPKTAVCRLPLMFGAAPPHASSFLQPFIRTLQERRELKLFVDEIRTPVSGTTAAKGLLLALQKVQGLIHLGGKERLSRYDFGRLMVEVFDLPTEGITAAHQQDVTMAAPRPPDTSLDSTKAFSIGYAPRSIREELETLRGWV